MQIMHKRREEKENLLSPFKHLYQIIYFFHSFYIEYTRCAIYFVGAMAKSVVSSA